MTLTLHAGATPADYGTLRTLETPPATQTHVPIPHFRVVDLVRATLGMYGHQITEEAFGVTEDGQRFFGLMTLKSPYTGYSDTCGLRNSHDKRFPIGISFGSRVFVCDNLAFIGDHVIKRKHTANAKTALPGLIMEVIELLAEIRDAQAKKIELCRSTDLTQEGRPRDHVDVPPGHSPGGSSTQQHSP